MFKEMVLGLDPMGELLLQCGFAHPRRVVELDIVLKSEVFSCRSFSGSQLKPRRFYIEPSQVILW